ncbi:MAG: hypothetical protein ACLGRW_15745 [Acidobacteriota bacterium]
MTSTNFVFIDRHRTPLCCVWIATGNPKQPLVCRWVGGESGDSRQVEVEAELWRARCA